MDTTTQDQDQMVDEFAVEELNGRQIKNVVRVAQALSLQQGQLTQKQHISFALNAMKCFDDAMETGGLPPGNLPHGFESGSSRKTKRRYGE